MRTQSLRFLCCCVREDPGALATWEGGKRTFGAMEIKPNQHSCSVTHTGRLVFSFLPQDQLSTQWTTYQALKAACVFWTPRWNLLTQIKIQLNRRDVRNRSCSTWFCTAHPIWLNPKYGPSCTFYTLLGLGIHFTASGHVSVSFEAPHFPLRYVFFKKALPWNLLF